MAFPVHAQIKSLYTSVDPKDCADGIPHESGQAQVRDHFYYDLECPGFGGYRVIVSGSEANYHLSLRYLDRTFNLRNPDAFHGMASAKIEWRYEVDKSQVEKAQRYRSIIYRLKFLEERAGSNPRYREELVVVRLQGAQTCVIGLVPQVADMNLKARQLADNPSLACLKL